MEFFAVNGKRPTRLSEQTRQFAYDSLNHKYGLEARKFPSVCMDDIDGFDDLMPLKKHDAAIRKIVSECPVRICEGERISGSANLGAAIDNYIPAVRDGKFFLSAESHLTIDFETVLKYGVDHIQSTAEASLEKYKGTEKEAFIQSCLSCIESFRIWHRRYLESLRDKEEYKKNYENLKNVPFLPAKNFYEAVQSIWFVFAFVRLCGNWPGIGRLDWLLGDYLEKDLREGTLTIAEAREILAHFFIKGCEWICGGDYGSGDAQHYQNILLGGVDENGKDVTCTVTYLVLDILEELGISDFPTTVRVNKHTPEKLLERTCEVIKHGGGAVAIYNEELIIDSLINYGYDPMEAAKFANDGCWEVQIPGKTFFTYIPFDGLAILQKITLDGYSENVNFSSFEELYRKYVQDLEDKTRTYLTSRISYSANVECSEEQKGWKEQTPCTVVSLFEKGCIEKGASYLEGGPVYNVISPHIGGLPDIANSLYAIKKLVFDEKKLSFSELMSILLRNWEGNEALRQYALNKYDYYGNDNDEVDEIAARIVSDFADICDEENGKNLYMTPAGISTFGRQLNWSPYRMATPSGRREKEVLGGNFSPTPGSDKEGATAIIKSYCKSDLKRIVSGAALDIKLLPGAVNGEKGAKVIESLIRGFVILGGHFMQIDIADTELLKKAQEHPEEYQTLSVRVSGWNARFVTLNKEWQDMIIAQTGCDIR